ncbi:MAG: hypothetical protein H3C68_03165 [Deltaproteobacteria bacterium]|nr:hypothetical protein [Deltaproteobacteria bacterium]MBZ0219727.1 hypothetical protein [Deltaproteobacteria bacterium]
MLSKDIPENVFALIRLAAMREDDDDFSLIGPDGFPKASYPVFQVRFKNRSTVWKYINKRTGHVVFETPEPLPLTRFGNAGTRQKPSLCQIKAEGMDIAGKVTRLVSEIFV